MFPKQQPRKVRKCNPDDIMITNSHQDHIFVFANYSGAWRTTLLSVLLVFLLSHCSLAQDNPERGQDEFVVVGYLPDYRAPAYDPANAAQLTDLVFFSIQPTATGDLNTRALSNKNLAMLKAVKEKHGCRIHIAVGGWGRSNHFAAMSAQKQSRQRFVDNLVMICHKHGIDGVDLDWEFPSTTTEKVAFVALLSQLQSRLRQDKLHLSIAVAGLQDLPLAAYEAVDRIHLMAYDAGIRHSTFADTAKFVQRLIERKVPPAKICLGLPLYGRHIKPPRTALTYAQIVKRHRPAPDVDEVAGIYFNGIRTIEKKTAYAHQTKLAGVMLWEISQDTHDETSLIRAVNRAKRP
jgi:GH18 family chitinase